jgi:EmrB/QacA subfamily drug resistance transporter
MNTATALDYTPDELAVEHTRVSRHLGWALVLISIAQLMVVLDGTVVSIALTPMQLTLGISEANLSWIVTGYALTFGGFLLLGGRLGDLYGRRRIFVAGVLIFATASLFGAFAQSETMLLTSRAVQGLGAALASPTALALITTTFPAGPKRNRAFAVYAAMSGAGAAVGLLLGGWLTSLDLTLLGTDVPGWRLTFFLVVPFGLVAALLAPWALSESQRHPGELDVTGAVLGTLGLTSIVFGFTRAGEADYGWLNGQTLSAIGLGVILLGAFAIVERRVAHPLLPFRIFRNGNRAAAFVAMMLMPAAMMAVFIWLTQYIQKVLGFSPFEAGLAFLPFSVGIVVGATTASKLVARVDPRVLAGLGTLAASAALFGYSRLPFDATLPGIDATASYWVNLLPFILLMSVGMGFVFVPMTLTAVHGLPDHDSGIGSGVLNTMQQVGGALGLAVISTVAVDALNSKAADLVQGARTLGSAAGLPADPAAQQTLLGHVALTYGATHAFVVAAAIALGASAVIWIFQRVKHEELATDGAVPAAH